MRLAAFIGALLLIVFALLQKEDEGGEQVPLFAVNEVELVGDFTYADPLALQQYYDQLLGVGLFSLSMRDLAEFAEQPAWVESVKIRRVWPHVLRVEITEHRPLAFWNSGQIITAEGKVIAPEVLPDLPLTRLSGPVDTETVVLDQFSLISQMLSTSSLRVSSLELEDRGAWDIWFSNGVGVKLGRNEVLERLGRFVAVYKSDLSGRIDQISSVDARYPHGVAVKWKSEE